MLETTLHSQSRQNPIVWSKLQFTSKDETIVCDVQMKAIEQYFHVFIMLNKVVLTFEPVDETLVCDHSNESY